MLGANTDVEVLTLIGVREMLSFVQALTTNILAKALHSMYALLRSNAFLRLSIGNVSIAVRQGLLCIPCSDISALCVYFACTYIAAPLNHTTGMRYTMGMHCTSTATLLLLLLLRWLLLYVTALCTFSC
jgi:hypothetical protein